MLSYWELGYRPDRSKDEAKFRAVSLFDEFDQAVAKTQARNLALGSYIAELEIPDEVEELSYNRKTGHHSVTGMTAEQLLESVCCVRPVPEVR